MAVSLRDVFSALGHTLSLPERLVRSLAAMLGGATKILTDTLVPEPLRRSNTFAAIVGNAQRFVIEQVAQVQGVYASESAGPLPDNYIPRKIAGNVLDAAGILSVHLSPLWVFAMVSDAAHGSKVYLNRLTDALKARGVISADVTVKEVDDLLGAVARAGRESAALFDAPPVDVAQLKQLRDQIIGGYQRVFSEARDLLPRMDQLWQKMEDLSRRENVAIESIGGLMTFDLKNAAGKTLGAAFAVGDATTDLLAETVLQSYGQTIDRIQREGLLAYMERATRPFVDAIASQIATGKETLTQRWWNWMVSPLLSQPPGDEPEPGPSNPPPVP